MRAPLTVVVVREDDDTLAVNVATILQERQVEVREISPRNAGELSLVLDADRFLVDGQLVDGIFFRVGPDTFFSHSFVEADRGFADAEVKAAWLAALDLPSVAVINRFDATAWYEGLGWPTWRRRLLDAGVSVATFAFGDRPESVGKTWYPYSGGPIRLAPGLAVRRLLGTALTDSRVSQSSVVLDGRVVSGEIVPAVLDAAHTLCTSGIRLAEIGLDQHGLILSVDVLPQITEPAALERATQLIGQVFYAHVHRR